MNEIKAFERRMGGRWTGVSFHREIPLDTRKVAQPMPFCKAVAASNTGALMLTRRTWMFRRAKKLRLAERSGLSLC